MLSRPSTTSSWAAENEVKKAAASAFCSVWTAPDPAASDTVPAGVVSRTAVACRRVFGSVCPVMRLYPFKPLRHCSDPQGYRSILSLRVGSVVVQKRDKKNVRFFLEKPGPSLLAPAIADDGG